MSHIAIASSLALAVGAAGIFFPPAGLLLGLFVFGAGLVARGDG